VSMGHSLLSKMGGNQFWKKQPVVGSGRMVATKKAILPLPHTIHVHQCTDARILLGKSHLVPPFVTPGVHSVRDIAIHMSFHGWQIEGDNYPGMPSRIAVARVPRKVSLQFRAMFTMPGSWQLSVASQELPVTSNTPVPTALPRPSVTSPDPITASVKLQLSDHSFLVSSGLSISTAPVPGRLGGSLC
jgi:hypothetical protein